MIRRIRELLYQQGFTISGARNKLDSHLIHEADAVILPPPIVLDETDITALRAELTDILSLLKP